MGTRNTQPKAALIESQDTFRAIAMMVGAMAVLALSDMFIKLATRTVPVGQVMLLLSLGGTLFFWLLALARRIPIFSRDALHPMVILRNAMEALGGLGLVLGIAYSPLSLLAAIMQAAPLIVTMGAAIFLHEQVGWRRWAAVFAGLVGMLLVVRPGAEGFVPASLFVVMGVVGLALRDLVTRLAPSHLHPLSLSTWGFAATIPAGAAVMLVTRAAPVFEPAGMALILGAVVVTTLGYYTLTAAMRMAPASVVTPYRYSRLIFTLGVGMLVFGERPDAQTYLGAAIIIIAGLYGFLRERRDLKPPPVRR